MLHTATEFTPVLADRGMVADALELIAQSGACAGEEARMRASNARNQGNILNFCRWRQIERLIGQLEPSGSDLTVH